MEKNHLDWDNFLPEIAQEIFSHLPAESALQCKQVSKIWQSLFGHMHEGIIFAIGLNQKEEPNFRLYYAKHNVIEKVYNVIKKSHKYHNVVKMVHHPPIKNRYHKNPSEKYKDVIVGSCNGLVCITLPNGVIDDPIYLCNPFTREFVMLPALTSIDANSVVVSGFGFYSTSEHKVVRIYYPDRTVSVGHVEIYTLGGGTGWRNKGEITYSLCPSPGVLVEGVLYWIDYRAMKIVGFSLADETFTLLPSPPCLCLDKDASNNNLISVEQSYRLKILRGCLCVVNYVPASKRILFKGSNRIDIWFLMKDDVHDKNLESNKYCHRSWRREFSIGNRKIEDDLDPFFVTEKNKVLLWHNKSDLVCFDEKSSTSKVIIKDEASLGLKYFNAIQHINTSASLKALEEKNCSVQEWDGKGTLDELRKEVKQQVIREIHYRPEDEIWVFILFCVLFVLVVFFFRTLRMLGGQFSWELLW